MTRTTATVPALPRTAGFPAFVLAALMTTAMLAGVNALAVSQPDGGVMAQQTSAAPRG